MAMKTIEVPEDILELLDKPGRDQGLSRQDFRTLVQPELNRTEEGRLIRSGLLEDKDDLYKAYKVAKFERRDVSID